MLKLTRTANAGVLLELDGTRILLDGVCREVSPYPATPDSIKTELSANYPDLVAVTHCHEDHCDPGFEGDYRAATGRQVIDPAFAGKTVRSKNVTLTAVQSRHIGKSDCDHVSFVIQGTQCVWFTGDASPNQWKNRQDLPRPDVLICPYAYATTEPAWRITRELSPKAVVLLHLPEREKDSFGLWQAVERVTAGSNLPNLLIPEIGDSVENDKVTIEKDKY